MGNNSRLKLLLALETTDRLKELKKLTDEERRKFRHHWRLWARDEQVSPVLDWRLWLILAGRGFGKTRAGAEWVREIADADPAARFALVGASLGDVRAVMVEGESGLIAISPPGKEPQFEPSLRRLQWANGAQATLYSAGEPDSLRGPQHSHAWCDEVAKWENASGRAEKAWDNLLLGLRLGEWPRVLATTTPRAVPLLKSLMASTGLALSLGATDDNKENLPTRFLSDVKQAYGDSLLARQELHGELIEDIPGALWTRSLLERDREPAATSPPARIVVGVDPSTTAHGDACGIVIAARGEDGIGRVLADATVEKAGPERWARAVAEAARAWQADRVVVEANQGGAMVESVLRGIDVRLPLRLVHASRGKTARAEPIAAMYEAGRIRHAGNFPRLEDELCGLGSGGSYQGPGRSPDRADALVWAMTDLMLGSRGQPRVWVT